jgi:hypothetical protein
VMEIRTGTWLKCINRIQGLSYQPLGFTVINPFIKDIKQLYEMKGL